MELQDYPRTKDSATRRTDRPDFRRTPPRSAFFCSPKNSRNLLILVPSATSMHIAHLDNFTVVGPFMTALLGRFACGGEVPMTSYGSTKLHVPLDAAKK